MTNVSGASPAPTHAAFHSRAVRSVDRSMESDPDVMVHQQLARLRFFEAALDVQGQRVLDFGCGSGFNCHELTNAKEVLGFDASPDAILLARKFFPNCRFEIADACSPSLSLGQWDRILCCEVLEHVPDMPTFLDNIKRHLSPDGTAFISTPNRDVFSLGHEPSPMNREHIKELNLQEFTDLLTARFSSVEIFGQSFRDPALLTEWEADVRKNIKSLEAGTRWKEPTHTRMSRNPLLRAIYRVPLLPRAWKWLRWSLIEGMKTRRVLRNRPYSYTDFEFHKDNLARAIWFCAIVSR